MKKPLLLHYYITEACNAKCTFCNIWKKKSPQYANPSHVLSNIREARKVGCRFVDFTGGEPLLHKDLPLFLSAAKEEGLITSVTTNTLLFKKRVSQLIGKIDLLHFSLDSDTAEEHDMLRGVRSYHSVLEAIDIACAHKMKPDILFTYTNENIHSLKGVISLCEEKKLMLILDPVFSDTGHDPVSASTHEYALQWAKHPRVYLNKAHLTLRQRGGNSTTAPRCKAVQSTVVILPDNTLALPCYHNKETAIPITPDLSTAYASYKRHAYLVTEGSHPYCSGCHINCYFDPSYLYRYDSLFLQSLAAKGRYFLQKYLKDFPFNR
ncbi:radical SAM protein [Chitinivibrio alkaliphilus]|uniref:Radical SAM domain-containing protein n=1 Tax=Chitinivibrio alkaliphilus ACht1 TaxID=1313304 RepID=U7D8T2_9BACT|nr:radical SAM protein [Chitinivibrio alkaliphilus]ERP38789.1 radical SAM domain-containing protein [Chitinivibrio alkaliphilus ACht1]